MIKRKFERENWNSPWNIEKSSGMARNEKNWEAEKNRKNDRENKKKKKMPV